MGLFFSGLLVGLGLTLLTICGGLAIIYFWKIRPLVAKMKNASGELPLPVLPSAKKTEYSLKLKDLNDEPFPLEKVKGKVIFLNFWATWCMPCCAEMPSIQNLYNLLKDQSDIVLLCVSTDKETKTVREFREKHNYSIAFFVEDGETPEEFKTGAIPATFVISPDGTVLFQHLGAARWDDPAFVNYLQTLAVKM